MKFNSLFKLIVVLGFLIVTYLTLSSYNSIQTNASNLKIGRLKYQGGGDWYANRTAIPNLIAFVNRELGTKIQNKEENIEPGSEQIFNFPFIYMTGHGTFNFSSNEAENLRNYLLGGGFLHIDDNYGLDPFVRPQLKKIFPEYELVELPFNHPIYHQKFKFNNGLPKIHEHDGKPAQGFAIIHQNKVVVYYSYESDLGNGWEDQNIYNNSPQIREKALQMGANLIMYAFSN